MSIPNNISFDESNKLSIKPTTSSSSSFFNNRRKLKSTTLLPASPQSVSAEAKKDQTPKIPSENDPKLSTNIPTTVSEDEDISTDVESDELLSSASESEDGDELNDRETLKLLSSKSLENKNKIIMVKIDTTLPRYGLAFYIQIAKLALSFTIIFIAFLVITGISEINNYVYLIVGSLATLLVVGIDIFYFFTYTQTNTSLTYDHKESIWTYVVFNAFVMVVAWFSLGRWCYVYASCCGFSESQPITSDLVNFVRFYGSYAIMLVLPAIPMIVLAPRAITAILYPTTTAPTKRMK